MSNTGIDRDRIANLVTQINALTPADNDRRNELLDELQDAVGFAGRMVMDRDILKKARFAVEGFNNFLALTIHRDRGSLLQVRWPKIS